MSQYVSIYPPFGDFKVVMGSICGVLVALQSINDVCPFLTFFFFFRLFFQGFWQGKWSTLTSFFSHALLPSNHLRIVRVVQRSAQTDGVLKRWRRGTPSRQWDSYAFGLIVQAWWCVSEARECERNLWIRSWKLLFMLFLRAL